MNVLIVHAHAEPGSFCTSMMKTAAQDLREQGHAVEVSDLHAMRWKAVADAADFGSRANAEYLVYALEQRHGYEAGTLAQDILAELAKLQRADLVIFSFPIYWFSMPAILKGWIDRVLISGLCYGGMRFYDRGGLTGKRAMLAVTIGGQQHMLCDGGIHGDLHEMLRPILRGTLAYAGMAVLPPFVAWHVPYVKPEQRDELMMQYRQRLREIDTLQPLSFPSMNDFDATLRPRLPAASAERDHRHDHDRLSQ